MSTSKLKIPVEESDHHLGNIHAPLQLVEYGDFECPYCGVAAANIDQIIKEFSGDLCYVYRHFPLANIHSHAEIAALAAEAADQQGQFWGMHYMMFANQDSLSAEKIFSYAQMLNLDIAKFRNDMRRNDLFARIQHDFNGGVLSGVAGTPTLYLNGHRLNGPAEYGFLRRALESELNSTATQRHL